MNTYVGRAIVAKILMLGASGLIGREVALKLFSAGHQLVFIGRNSLLLKKKIGLPCAVFEWVDVTKDPFPTESLQGVDHVVHLAGEPIAERRWSASTKKRIVESRVVSTQKLVNAIIESHSSHRIQSIVCSSAIGFYGDAGNEFCDEQSLPGQGFLAETCVAWEQALFGPISQHAPRRVAIRTGIVLALQGGALDKMLPLMRAGFGGKLGGGKQWMSWIHIDDIVGIIEQSVFDKRIKGPINAVAPNPVPNSEFIKSLAHVLKKPSIFSVPTAALKLALGEMSHTVTDSQRVVPAVMLKNGYEFKFPKLQAALENLLADGAHHQFKVYQWIPKPVNTVFEFFSEAKNLERITPPWLHFHIDSMSTPTIEKDTMIYYRLKIKGLPATWHTHISQWKPPLQFVDEQRKGPYRKWHHTHQFFEVQSGTLVVDTVRYSLPFGVLGDMTASGYIGRDIESIFSFRFGKISEFLN